MAGGKISPRQKMINMMYLVLTALLAMNVSKEVINAFKNVDSSINKTIKVLNDKKLGGEIDFDPTTDKNTENRYGLSINTERYEMFGKMGYVFPQQKYKSIGLQVDAINHDQASYFGLTNYNAKQQSLYGNLIYQSIIFE